MQRIAVSLALFLLACQPFAQAQEKSPEQQIAEAVMALPEPLRDGAAVKGNRNGELVDLREGTNPMICLADAPGDDRWHVACYHKDLEPFMARGRELRAAGVEDDERQQTRFDEIESKKLAMPLGPTALYSLSGPADAYDSATGEANGVRGLHVVYVPYATEASLGISTEPSRERPWLMLPGMPSAHIMIPRP